MELKLPLLGDVMTEGTLVEWLQPDGATIAAGEPLYQLETDKVTFTIDAPSDGRLERIIAEGETVAVGTVVGRILEGAAESNGDGEVRASPAARRLARELGVDLAAVGTGRRLREADIRAFHAERSPALPHGAPLAGRRRVIAERMRASLGQTAQLTISLEVDMTDAQRLRQQLKQLLAEGSQPSVTDVVIRASVLALREHPALNATLENGQLTVHDVINVGVAVDVPEGLMVPILRDAAAVPLRELGARTRDLADRARANQLAPDELQGGTFTVTSLGMYGVDFFTPIINPPQVAILGIGRIFSRLALADAGRVEAREAMYLNLSFDHQVVDGAPAARFLQSVKRLLELPASLLV